jgi:hypothetical protein
MYGRPLSGTKILLAKLTMADLESVVTEVTRPVDEEEEVNINPRTKFTVFELSKSVRLLSLLNSE